MENPLYLMFSTPFSADIFTASTLLLGLSYFLVAEIYLPTIHPQHPCKSRFSHISSFNSGTQKLVHAINEDEDAAKLAKRIERQKSWIITMIASGLMTAGSLPFMLDFVKTGDVARVQRREELAAALCSFFLAYLSSDLLIGSMCYAGQISVLTGWIHHLAYSGLMFLLIKLQICHIFAMCAFMELPTLVLAVSMLFPSTRYDLLFSILFFMTRICFHAVLVGCYATSYGRTYGTGLLGRDGLPLESLIPLYGLLLAAPLHLSWFYSSIKGMMRRHSKFQQLTPHVQQPLTPTLATIKEENLDSLVSQIPQPDTPIQVSLKFNLNHSIHRVRAPSPTPDSDTESEDEHSSYRSILRSFLHRHAPNIDHPYKTLQRSSEKFTIEFPALAGRGRDAYEGFRPVDTENKRIKTNE